MFELLLIVFIIGNIVLANPANLGALLGYILSPLLWLAVYIGYRLYQHFHNGQNRLYQYLYIGAVSGIFKYIDVTILAPVFAGSSPDRLFYHRIFFSITASLFITACYNGIKILRNHK